VATSLGATSFRRTCTTKQAAYILGYQSAHFANWRLQQLRIMSLTWLFFSRKNKTETLVRCITQLVVLSGSLVLVLLIGGPVSASAYTRSVSSQQQSPQIRYCGKRRLTLSCYDFRLINSERSKNNLPAYQLDSTLSRVAQAHSDLMASGCGLQHQCSGEPDLGTRIKNAGLSFTSAGENIGYAYGYGTSKDNVLHIHQLFMSEGPCGCGNHYDHIMSTKFQKVGVGVTVTNDGTVWLTEDYIQP
jgi:uncharacterized protein YkwD